jgi:alkylation response protein AidB-like acyl-CoA dehydrogenase
VTTPSAAELHLRDCVKGIASSWKSQRAERQTRLNLDRVDFDALREVRFLQSVVPVETGGLWQDTGSSARIVCESLRELASADPAVALVSAMHSSVVGYWLLNPDPSEPDWEAQRQDVFASAMAGEQWGTITSEPGSGGDMAKTRATATPTDNAPFMVGAAYTLSGDKHFGSGSGIADRMVTTAIADGENAPSMFVLDASDRRWDGSAGWTLTAEWDGVGMRATQSHAMRLDGASCVRLSCRGGLSDITTRPGPFVATSFTGVIVGVLDEAIAVARNQLRAKSASLRPFEQVEWTRAVCDHWLAVQAYEGALRAIEAGDARAMFAALSAKATVAELAEDIMARLSRVIGGGAFSRRSPFAHWHEDVRALGFLRPPWGLAYDSLFSLTFA